MLNNITHQSIRLVKLTHNGMLLEVYVAHFATSYCRKRHLTYNGSLGDNKSRLNRGHTLKGSVIASGVTHGNTTMPVLS